LTQFNGSNMWLSRVWLQSESIKLYSDAAITGGFAAIFGSKWFVGTWPAIWQSYHIQVLELFPIVAALELWGPLVANHRLTFTCDNMAVVHAINNMTSKEKLTMRLLRRFVIACMKYNVLCRAQHIPGKHNVIADHLSRFQFTKARELASWLDACPQKLPDSLLPWLQ